jgi:hypothetical protein
MTTVVLTPVSCSCMHFRYTARSLSLSLSLSLSALMQLSPFGSLTSLFDPILPFFPSLSSMKHVWRVVSRFTFHLSPKNNTKLFLLSSWTLPRKVFVLYCWGACTLFTPFPFIFRSHFSTSHLTIDTHQDHFCISPLYPYCKKKRPAPFNTTIDSFAQRKVNKETKRR